jgi:uracil-DNA glycosylase
MASLKEELLVQVQRMKQHVRQRMRDGEMVTVFQKEKVAQQSIAPAPVSAPAKKAEPKKPSSEFEQLAQTVQSCTQCDLAQTRKRVVFGEGDVHAKLVFVGEAPGADEDREGRPFVGAEGKLLTKIIESIGLDRGDVYICNVLKCRPQGNRNPDPKEIAACQDHLIKQLELLKPKLICVLGTFAAQTLLGSQDPIGRLRGKTYTYQNIPVIPTFHPAALLYHPQNKKLVWEDMQRVAKALGQKIPSKK